MFYCTVKVNWRTIWSDPVCNLKMICLYRCFILLSINYIWWKKVRTDPVYISILCDVQIWFHQNNLFEQSWSKVWKTIGNKNWKILLLSTAQFGRFSLFGPLMGDYYLHMYEQVAQSCWRAKEPTAFINEGDKNHPASVFVQPLNFSFGLFLMLGKEAWAHPFVFRKQQLNYEITKLDPNSWWRQIVTVW